jgi:SAM-dependent methyltransferase
LSSRFADATFGHLTLGKAKRHVGDGLRSEDGTDISRDAGSLDLLLSVEVLEYVPDLSKAIAAMVRVLRPGGKALIAIPWVGQEDYEHLIKAEIGGDGFVRHLQSPGYHRDGDADEQFLRFRAFGWKLLDELRSAGFSRATAEYVFAPVHGYMTLHPIITATK